MPMDPKWGPELLAIERVEERYNRHLLIVDGLAGGRYGLFEGDRKVGRATAEELADGLNLARLPELSTNRRAAELFPLVLNRDGMLGASWLQAVGHGDPPMFGALPLDEAKRRAASIEAKIRALAEPTTIRLRLVPEAG